MISEALAIINSELTNEVPPGIKEAFEVMINIRKSKDIVDVESAERVFNEIKARWKELFSSLGISCRIA